MVRALAVAEAEEIGFEAGARATDQEEEGEVGGHRAEAPRCLAPSQVAEEEGLRAITDGVGVVGGGIIQATNLM